MSRPDDLSDDMFHFPSSAEADRLLSGRLSPDDLPDEAAPLARLLGCLEPVATDDPFTEQRVVAGMTAAILRNPAPGSRVVVGSVERNAVRSAKAGALAFAAVLATGTAAAAASGSLPTTMQRAVSDALSHVSISVPRPAPHRPQPVESHSGGTDGSPDGGSPGGATGAVGPRGVQRDKDDAQTPRGSTNTTPGEAKSRNKRENGNHNAPPSSVPNGPKPTNPNNGRGNGESQGRHQGEDNGQHNGADRGKKKGQTDPSPVTTTTVKKGNGKVKDTGKDESSAGGNGHQNGNAGSPASLKVSGSGPERRA